ncbi:unnamed protein product [Ceutorhynchus assimilis]|uniref:Uncharacterized protein n=1 Tax=Ceutorhynchus assimilis TaxID=467358 RepID=A0A9N9MNZ5_9CUCU|nr:unnamed protein product [Ceutorhynchus assimilis]
MSSQENMQRPKGDLETPLSPKMESIDFGKHDPEYHLANETLSSPRSLQSTRSLRSRTSSEAGDRPASTRDRSPTKKNRSRIIRPQPHNSSIPLPMKITAGPIKPLPAAKIPSKIVCKTPVPRLNVSANKHTLEVQFINKNKRLVQLKKELLEKQKPVIEIYQSLTTIKKKLQQMGKNVKLDEVKLVPYQDLNETPEEQQEQMSMEIIGSMKLSIEEIPKTLMDICKNLLSRRALIVELLESVTKSEVDVGLVSEKITSLKCEGLQLQQSLDMVIKGQEVKICELVENWQKLLKEKQSSTNDLRIEELENKLKEEQKSKEESEIVIRDLHNKIDERKTFQDKTLGELNGVVISLKEQIKKLDQDLESERKATIEFKGRNSANAQTLKNLRTRVNELERQSSEKDTTNAELQKKIKLLQDQMKHKEILWNKEKEEMAKSLKHQENLLQKVTADKNRFETRLQSEEQNNEETKGQMQEQISLITEKLLNSQAQLEKVTLEKNQIVEKNKEFEQYISRTSASCKETMNKVSCSIEWGNASRHASTPEAENYMLNVVKDVRIMELEDKLNQIEQERKLSLINAKSKMDFIRPSIIEHELETQKDLVKGYQLILEDGEKKLKHKLKNLRTIEIEKLNAQIHQLKVRQEKYEQENGACSFQELKRMLDDGRQKLTNVVQRFVTNDDKVEDLRALIEKQKIQMSEMANLIKYRENVTSVLKNTRDKLMAEKQSLGRYSREVRTILIEVSTQSTKKDEKLKYFEQKIASRETQIAQLEINLNITQEKLQIVTDKRYKLQETITKQEKDLQKSSKEIEQLKTMLNKSGKSSWGFLDTIYDLAQKDKPNKKIIKCCSSNTLMPSTHKNSILDSEPATNTQKVSFCKMYPQSHCCTNSSTNSQVAKSSALLGHSLQTIDVVTTRLNFLNALTEESLHVCDNIVNWDGDNFKSQFEQVFKMAAHRYEYTQNQAKKSYQDLTDLLKFAITHSSSTQTK